MIGRWWRPALLVALIVVAIAVAITTGVPSVAQVRAVVDGAGTAAPVAFAVLYAALSLTPVPASVVSIAAGVLFGLPVGFLAVLAGALSGAVAGFTVARLLGRDTVTRISGKQVARLDALLRRRGVLAVAGLRMVPVIPFSSLNLVFGLTGVRVRDYLAGTAVGILPATTAYVTIGAYGATPGSLPFLLAVGGLALLAIGGLVVHRRSRTARVLADERTGRAG